MPDVFISDSHADRETVRRYAQMLEAEGLNVWWDNALRSGEAFDEKIEQALREAKAVVVLWSKTSVASRWVRAEATLADRSKTLIPVMIEPCERPIMFELTHTVELSHSAGDSSEPVWLDFVAEVLRFVAKHRHQEALAAAPAPPAPQSVSLSERRQIAVLNCAPSVAPEADVDPDDWHDIVSGFRADAERIVGAFGGKVIDAPGDGLLAFFGLDHSREDDAMRAVNAALKLRSRGPEGRDKDRPSVSA